MDPISLVAMASTTFKGVQVLVSKGAEIEHVAKKLGHWYGLVSDIKEAEKERLEAEEAARKLEEERLAAEAAEDVHERVSQAARPAWELG